MNINASKCLKHNGGETTCPFGLFVTFKGAPSMSTVFNFMLKCYSNIWPSRVYYQKSSKVMHEFRSCKLLLSWRLKTNDLRDYLQRVIKQYFFVRFFFSLNFAIFQCDKNYEFRPLCKENSRSLTEKKVGYSFFA